MSKRGPGQQGHKTRESYKLKPDQLTALDSVCALGLDESVVLEIATRDVSTVLKDPEQNQKYLRNYDNHLTQNDHHEKSFSEKKEIEKNGKLLMCAGCTVDRIVKPIETLMNQRELAIDRECGIPVDVQRILRNDLTDNGFDQFKFDPSEPGARDKVIDQLVETLAKDPSFLEKAERKKNYLEMQVEAFEKLAQLNPDIQKYFVGSRTEKKISNGFRERCEFQQRICQDPEQAKQAIRDSILNDRTTMMLLDECNKKQQMLQNMDEHIPPDQQEQLLQGMVEFKQDILDNGEPTVTDPNPERQEEIKVQKVQALSHVFNQDDYNACVAKGAAKALTGELLSPSKRQQMIKMIQENDVEGIRKVISDTLPQLKGTNPNDLAKEVSKRVEEKLAPLKTLCENVGWDIKNDRDVCSTGTIYDTEYLSTSMGNLDNFERNELKGESLVDICFDEFIREFTNAPQLQEQFQEHPPQVTIPPVEPPERMQQTPTPGVRESCREKIQELDQQIEIQRAQTEERNRPVTPDMLRLPTTGMQRAHNIQTQVAEGVLVNHSPLLDRRGIKSTSAVVSSMLRSQDRVAQVVNSREGTQDFYVELDLSEGRKALATQMTTKQQAQRTGAKQHSGQDNTPQPEEKSTSRMKK